jgi:hypothetical protein
MAASFSEPVSEPPIKEITTMSPQSLADDARSNLFYLEALALRFSAVDVAAAVRVGLSLQRWFRRLSLIIVGCRESVAESDRKRIQRWFRCFVAERNPRSRGIIRLVRDIFLVISFAVVLMGIVSVMAYVTVCHPRDKPPPWGEEQP